MNLKPVITGLLLLLALAGVVAVFWTGGNEPAVETPMALAEGALTEGALTEGALPDQGVVVYYFHGYKRCLTCNKIEALADESIRDRYPELMRDGSVVFKAVNIETEAERHFVNDYELVNKVVVLSERRDGREVGWQRLDLVWEKVGDDDEYRAYITSNLAAGLKRVGLESS